MLTRAKTGIHKPISRLNLNVNTSPDIPKSHIQALSDPNWKQAMLDEYNALIKNGSWVLVPRPSDRYKACLVANGKSQRPGIDCGETFSLVIKPATIRAVLSLSVTRHWPIHQLDVKNAFLNGELTYTIYMHQPSGFHDPTKPGYKIIASLCKEFSMTDVGPLNYFLGISATRNKQGMFLSQQKYALDILDRADMSNYTPCSTPGDTQYKLGPNGPLVMNPTLYRSLAGALQYLTFTRPDIMYVVQQLFLFMQDPREPHFNALKRVLRYIRGTVDNGLQIFPSSITKLIAYSDADWGGCPDTRLSTSGYCVFLGDNILSWSSKRQATVSRSSTEDE
ncbi:uncharacterized mitochondrial protein AtMg00810-like [Rutidosis leptorrhynchoides]|uniref:uncharacterized mitochondrial protein AtMg00810-like n=1 Tax=Rutidosis leptorrhynchoides TaxID=125765 RepID=UPI003A99CACB